jgi:oxygen-dependent protoporphyrinogen oxidase
MAAAGAARRPRVLVAGGGISGLSLAWFVRRLVPSARVTIAEASNRAGGWVHSRRHAGGDVEELGPRSALPRSERLLRLIYDIGYALAQTLAACAPTPR